MEGGCLLAEKASSQGRENTIEPNPLCPAVQVCKCLCLLAAKFRRLKPGCSMSLAKHVILIQMQPLNERCHLGIASVMVVWTEMTSSFHFFCCL